MGITTQIPLTDEWVQVADAGQRVVLQRLTGSLYLRYAATQPDADNNEAFRLFDNVPLELSNDQPLWAKAKRQGYLILVPVPTVTAGGGTGGATEVTLAAVDAKLGGTLSVNVTNQLDLTDITSHLLAIKNSAAAIDANTDTVEQKIADTITAINNSGAVNHADLLTILTQLQAVNANTDTLEAVLGSVLAKIIASPATLTEQQAQTTLLNNVAKDGADITTPFAMPAGGSGIRGWLSAIWTKLNGTVAVSSASLPLPTGAATAAKQLADNHQVAVSNFPATQPVSAAALPLPAGASTSANQTTGNNLLTSVDAKTPALVNGRSPVIAQTYLAEVARGNVAGETLVALRGYDKSSSTTQELVWAESASGYPLVTSAQTLTLSSSDNNDTSAGTGARTVLVKYIEFSTGNEASTVVTLNGKTAVQITTDGYAINELRVLTAGSTNSNVGTVYAGYGTVSGGGVPANILSTVDNNTNVSQQLLYTVPTGKTLEIYSYGVTVSKLTYVQFRIRPSKNNGLTYIEYDLPINGAAPTPLLTVPIIIEAGQQLQVWAASSGGTALVGVTMRGVLR